MFCSNVFYDKEFSKNFDKKWIKNDRPFNDFSKVIMHFVILQ